MSGEPEKLNWVKEMIEREATPKTMRTETVEKFAERHGIVPSNYHYHKVKKENQEKIVKLCLLVAKESLPEVLEKLGENAKAGKEKSIEMYLKFIAGLSEKIDMTSGGKPIPILNLKNVPKNDSDNENSKDEEQNKSGSGWDECKQDNINSDLSDSPRAE